jgi:hypothetical protein
MASFKKSPEGNSYASTWKKVGKGFGVSVKGRPELYGEGSTFSEARSALVECIVKATGDGEPVIQFDKALPKGALPEELSRPEILWISGNDTARILDPSRLYEGGICRTCGNPLGNRNAMPVSFLSAPNANSDGVEAPLVASMFSEAFVGLLAGLGGAIGTFRKVEWAKKKGKSLFEIAGKPLAQTVVLNSAPVQGVQCVGCKRKIFHQLIAGDLIPVLPAADLPSIVPPWFLAQNPVQPILCMLGKVWRSIQGQPGTHNVVATPIAVAPEGQLTRDPKLPMFKG